MQKPFPDHEPSRRRRRRRTSSFAISTMTTDSMFQLSRSSALFVLALSLLRAGTSTKIMVNPFYVGAFTLDLPSIATSRHTTTCSSLFSHGSHTGSTTTKANDEMIERIYVLSDLHTDHILNKEWLEQECRAISKARNQIMQEKDDDESNYNSKTMDEQQANSSSTRTTTIPVIGPNDAIIVAGDISHDLEMIQETFEILQTNLQCSIWFVPGNHEAWMDEINTHKSKKMNNATTFDTKRQTVHNNIKKARSDVNDNEGEDVSTTQNDLKTKTSFDKLCAIESLCQSMGIRTDHALVGTKGSSPTWIVPLHSWYDGSLQLPSPECDDLIDDMSTWPWVDFRRCLWPAEYYYNYQNDDNHRLSVNSKCSGEQNTCDMHHDKFPKPELVSAFLQQNDRAIDDVRASFFGDSRRKDEEKRVDAKVDSNINKEEKRRQRTNHNIGLITFSHFLPNAQTLPDWKDVNEPQFLSNAWLDHPGPGVSAKFALVAGSSQIDDQIRSIVPADTSSPIDDSSSRDRVTSDPNSDSSFYNQEPSRAKHIHVFGHSHRPKDFSHKGIRYVHNPLGKPRERESFMIDPNVTFKCIWDCTSQEGEVPYERSQPLTRYWEQYGGGLDRIEYYLKKRKVQRKLFIRRISRSSVEQEISSSSSSS